MILLNDLFGITQFKEWTICLNNDVEEDICTLLDENETESRKQRLRNHIAHKKTRSQTFRKIDTDKCLQFLRLKGYKDRWLFLGAFENKGSHMDREGIETYDLEMIDDYREYAERLIVKYTKTPGDKQAKLSEKRYLSMEVLEIVPDIYSRTYKPFQGYDRIRLSFTEMKRIFETPYLNWKEALSIVNGIYVITDKSNGKAYVGSTYGFEGVWQRWMKYVETNGHGGDTELKKLVENDPDYAIKYFQFSLVEFFFNIKKGKNNSIIIERENYWKEVLNTRILEGYNKN